MIKIVDGDIFNCDADAILHQVNCQGVNANFLMSVYSCKNRKALMGSGVAKQVREKFPTVFKYYKARCDEDKRFKEQFIINLFAQDRYGYDGNCYTDYAALRKCLKMVNEQFSGKRVAIPYLMACHRGGGDWDKAYESGDMSIG